MGDKRLNKYQQDAEDRLGHYAVSLIGNTHPVMRYAGDNMGGRAVRTVVTQDPANAAKVYETKQPYHQIRVLFFAWCLSRDDASHFQAAVDFVILRDGEEARYGFKTLNPNLDIARIGSVFAEAHKTSGIFAFDQDEHMRLVNEEVARYNSTVMGKVRKVWV